MKCGLLGAKLGHSFSPLIHQQLYKMLGMDATYELIEVPAENLLDKVTELRRKYTGLNVTIPHKVAVMAALDEVVPAAKAIGAVNTIHIKNGIATGYNTDYIGFSRLLNHNKLKVDGKKIAVLGTGGAARAVLQCLEDENAMQIYLVTRSKENVPADLKKRFADSLCTYDELADVEGDILVNCTPVGMSPNVGKSPVGENVIKNFAALVDVIYNPQETEFLRLGKAQGKKAVNGIYMLIAQAVAAEEIWLEQPLDHHLVAKLETYVLKLLQAQAKK
jgi:shikimate dehydrogenase